MAKLNPIIASSANPQEVSLMIKGALTLIVPIAGMVIRASGGSIADAELQTVVENIGDAVTAIGSALVAVQVVIGGARKIYYALKK